MDSTRAFLDRMNKPPVRPAILFRFQTKDGRVYAKLENGQIVRRTEFVPSPTGKSAIRPSSQQ